MEHRSLGVCLGSATIKAVELVESSSGVRIGKTVERIHESNPIACLGTILDELDGDCYDYEIGRAHV